MKIKHIVILLLAILAGVASCQRKRRVPEPNVIGTILVDLNANEAVIRKKEALIGNMIADALKMDYDNHGKPVDFVIVNAGSIRFSTSKRPTGIYQAGSFSAEMADEMLPFANITAVVKITGKQLKEVMERSVAQYPLAKGPFMQLSKEIKVIVDTTKTAQVLNINNTAIVTQGDRIVSIKINDVEYNNQTVYKVGVSDFIADGNDGYVTFKNVSSSLKELVGEDQANALKEYVITKSPIEPKLEDRIVFQ